MGVLFSFFFIGSPVIALVIFPFLRVVSSDTDYRRRCTDLLEKAMWFMAHSARFCGIADFDDDALALPPEVDPAKPYVMICNHPTFIDMILLMGSYRGLTCVTSGRWSRHWALGRLLRSTNYLPGPGSGLPESEDMLGSMVAHLRAGHPLLVFPEGRRSLAHELRRFRRGAVAAAVEADVPIVPVFLALDRPYLTKAVPIWRPPVEPPTYGVEWFDVVRPAEHGADAKRIHRELVAKYRARFAEQLVRQRAISASDAATSIAPPSGAPPSEAPPSHDPPSKGPAASPERPA